MILCQKKIGCKYIQVESIHYVEVQDETSNRSNNFEVTSITYKSPEVLTGWDDI